MNCLIFFLRFKCLISDNFKRTKVAKRTFVDVPLPYLIISN